MIFLFKNRAGYGHIYIKSEHLGFNFSFLLWLISSLALGPVGFLLLFFFFQCEFLLLDNLKLITEVEFGSLLLELCEFVFVFGNLLQSRLNELATKIVNLGIEIVDLNILALNNVFKIVFLILQFANS